MNTRITTSRRLLTMNLTTKQQSSVLSKTHLLPQPQTIAPPRRFLSTTVEGAFLTRPVRPTSMTAVERATLRASRKERAAQVLQQAQEGTGATGTAKSSSSSSSSMLSSPQTSRWMWYLGMGVPTILITWAVQDENSPPAQLAKTIGLTDSIANLTDPYAQPVYDKLLPDWADMPNVPQDIPIPHTLVLDLEKTLVSSTWDRKHGWR